MAGFLEYVEGESFLHRMNPVAKLFCALLLSVACFCTDNVVFLAAVLVLDMVMAQVCNMMRQVLGLVRAVLFFSIVLALIQLFSTSTGVVLVELPWGYVGTGSLLAAIVTIVRLIAAAVPLFLVLYVTKLTDLSNACCKVVHVPYKYAFTFTSTIHFIPVFMNDMHGIMEAQTARGVEFDTGGVVKKMRLMVPLCVPLLVSSVRKTNSAAIAAEVRGFNLRTSASGYKSYPFSAFDIVAIVVCITLVVCAVILSIGIAIG